MKIKTSYRKLIVFSQLAQGWMQKHPEKTKLMYALNRVIPQLGPISNKAQETLEAIDVDHCAVDEKEIVIVEAGAYKYTKDELKKRNAERTRFFDAEDIELEAHYATQLPDDLTIQEIEAFQGIVINPADVQLLIADENFTETAKTAKV